MKRLYILTGKGGVGKTTVSLTLAKYLSENSDRKVKYLSFNREVSTEFLKDLDIDFQHIDLLQSTEIYIGRKLNSQTIASWILKTPFFMALYNMLPSLGQMVTLGHILDMLNADPNLTIVMDSPASGHALSMFESTHTFKKIFGQGPIVKDIEKMHELLYDPAFLKTIILTLPTEMATQEAIELKQYLKGLNFNEIAIAINDCLTENPILNEQKEELADLLIKKIRLEKEVINEEKVRQLPRLAHYFTNDTKELILALKNSMEALK